MNVVFRPSSMAYLKKEDIEGGALRYRRRKTGSPIEMSLTKELLNIINSFSEETTGSPYVFPVIGDTKVILTCFDCKRVQ